MAGNLRTFNTGYCFTSCQLFSFSDNTREPCKLAEKKTQIFRLSSLVLFFFANSFFYDHTAANFICRSENIANILVLRSRGQKFRFIADPWFIATVTNLCDGLGYFHEDYYLRWFSCKMTRPYELDTAKIANNGQYLWWRKLNLP